MPFSRLLTYCFSIFTITALVMVNMSVAIASVKSQSMVSQLAPAQPQHLSAHQANPQQMHHQAMMDCCDGHELANNQSFFVTEGLCTTADCDASLGDHSCCSASHINVANLAAHAPVIGAYQAKSSLILFHHPSFSSHPSTSLYRPPIA